MAVFTKEEDWFEGALATELPCCRPGKSEPFEPRASQWSDDDPVEEPDADDDPVELPLGG